MLPKQSYANKSLTRLVLLLTACVTLVAGESAEGWWTNSKGEMITSFSDFKEILTKTHVDKVVIVDFYMQNCYWC